MNNQPYKIVSDRFLFWNRDKSGQSNFWCFLRFASIACPPRAHACILPTLSSFVEIRDNVAKTKCEVNLVTKKAKTKVE